MGVVVAQKGRADHLLLGRLVVCWLLYSARQIPLGKILIPSYFPMHPSECEYVSKCLSVCMYVWATLTFFV